MPIRAAGCSAGRRATAIGTRGPCGFAQSTGTSSVPHCTAGAVAHGTQAIRNGGAAVAADPETDPMVRPATSNPAAHTREARRPRMVVLLPQRPQYAVISRSRTARFTGASGAK